MSFLERIFGRGEAARRRAVMSLGIEAGAFEECPVCREVIDCQREDRMALAANLAEEWVRRGDPRVEVFHGDVSSLRRTLLAVEKRLDVACTCEGR
jgi:hypothetical protein